MLRWRKVRTVTRREYLSRVQTKAFWISTALVPVALLVFTIGPGLLARRSGGSFTVALVSPSPELGRLVESRITAANRRSDDQASGLRVTLVAVPAADDEAQQRAELKRAVAEERYDSVVLLPGEPLVADTFEYLSANVTAFGLMSRLEAAVQSAVVELRLTGAGLPADEVDALTRKPGMVPVRISPRGDESRESGMQSFFLSYLMTFLIFLTMMIYGMYVMRGVLEEKSSRIVEVVVANLSPNELMVGKILGVGAVGLTQYAIWVVLAMNLAVPGVIPSLLGEEGAKVMLSPALLGFFVLFFVLGYVLYSTIYAALGAFFNSEEEAQQMQAIAGWLMAVPFLLMFPIMSNPNSLLSTVVSLVPFFSPMLYFLRLSVQPPPAWQTLLAVALLLITIGVVARFAAVVYRVGILMVGKKPTLREILRSVREA